MIFGFRVIFNGSTVQLWLNMLGSVGWISCLLVFSLLGGSPFLFRILVQSRVSGRWRSCVGSPAMLGSAFSDVSHTVFAPWVPSSCGDLVAFLCHLGLHSQMYMQFQGEEQLRFVNDREKSVFP